MKLSGIVGGVGGGTVVMQFRDKIIILPIVPIVIR